MNFNENKVIHKVKCLIEVFINDISSCKPI